MSVALEDVLFDLTPGQDWHMQYSERVALHYILSRINPDVSIEIGTFRCGSLGPISRASKNVYTFDIDPNQHRNKAQFPNVEFITGNSAHTLPPIIEYLNKSERELEFILVDGSHEEEGVRLDLVECLKYRPKKSPTMIVMHDSSNPVVRAGIKKAPWQECPYVHALDLDFVPGMLYNRADIAGEIWGGLAVALMLPQPREGDLVPWSTFEPSRSVLMQHSIYDKSAV
ncbi:class I SAM-dependent methyltransferase [Brevundimonas sp.]